MAKIFICDAVQGKTTKHFTKWARENHEVVTDMYFNPVYAEWADLIYIEWCEPPAIEASRLKGHYDGVYDHEGVWGEKNAQYTKDFDWSGKPIYIRGIDMDIYYGHYHAVNWANITGFFYIAEHIRDYIGPFPFPDTLKIAHAPLSVDPSVWHFRERDGAGKKLAWINHNWSGKGLPLMLQAFEKLVRVTGDKTWELHVVSNGKSTEPWLHNGYIPHIVKALGIQDQVKFWDSQPNLDEFLEDKDYLVSSSLKEAFSLILAEAMCKGMKVLTHNWWGADLIWPDEVVWKTVDEFAEKMLLPWNSQHYRELAEKYTAEKEVAKLRELMNI